MTLSFEKPSMGASRSKSHKINRKSKRHKALPSSIHGHSRSMTIAKHHHAQVPTASLASKLNLAPKKAVTIHKAVKFAVASSAAAPNLARIGVDTSLQGDDKCRKYMRRGSKTPAMLLLPSELDLDVLLQDLSEKKRGFPETSGNSPFNGFELAKECSGCELDPLPVERPRDDSLCQPRRLSMMSALKQKMEQTSISVTKQTTTAANPLRRRLSLDLVM